MMPVIGSEIHVPKVECDLFQADRIHFLRTCLAALRAR